MHIRIKALMGSALAATLAACGGGGDDAPVPVVVMPDVLAVVPASATVSSDTLIAYAQSVIAQPTAKADAVEAIDLPDDLILPGSDLTEPATLG